MLDIETTGIDPTSEDLLQIGVLEADFVNGSWVPGRSLVLYQHTSRSPGSEFAKKHMAELYKECNSRPYVPQRVLRQQLLEFFRECGIAKGIDTYLMGWNASNFDVPFLVNKGVLAPSRYEIGPDGKDVFVGDFHYRIYEMGGAVSLVANVLNRNDRKRLLEEAEAWGEEVSLPAGKEHDALYDCYKQLRILNGLIRMARL